jgi:hypothetical protein
MPLNKKRKKCEAGSNCVCLGKSVKDIFEHFLEDLTNLETASQTERAVLLSSASPCLINITLPDRHYKELKKYKAVLLKICCPRVKHRSALVRLLRWHNILPKILTTVITALAGTAAQLLANVDF